MRRRQFIARTSAATLFLGLPVRKLMFPGNIEAKPLTKGPDYHWFGYYDKLQTDPAVKYVLGMQNTIQHRSPAENDRIGIGMIDLNDSNRWIDIGESISWGWQQGCMLQWIPGSYDEIIWNNRESGSFVSHIYNIRTGRKRTLPKAVYALSPDGKWAIGTEFSRIDNLRPGYGYAGIPDPYEMVKAPGDIGIYKIDLQDGTDKLLFSLASVGHDTMIVNGHNTYVPGTNNEWILNDTYPQGQERLQEIYLYNVPSGKKISLGKYHEPEEYRGEWRCDLHPKCTPDGKKVIFDSTHGGNGRQIYMIDISEIL